MQIAWYCCHTLHFTPLFSLSVQYHEKARYLVVTKLSSCLYSLSHPQFSFIKAVEGMYVVLTRITRKYWYTVHIVCVWARIRRRLILNAELAKLRRSTRHVIFSMMVFAPVSLSLILTVYIRLVFFLLFPPDVTSKYVSVWIRQTGKVNKSQPFCPCNIDRQHI